MSNKKKLEQKVDEALELSQDISGTSIVDEGTKVDDEGTNKVYRKVAIVGFAPSWSEAPYNDPTFEKWGINDLYVYTKDRKFDRWFEVHDPKSPSKNKPRHQKWLRECSIPLYMREHYEEYPMSRPYPRQEVKDMCNEYVIQDNEGGSKYTDFSNQITWMILLAIYEGYDEIHVYGVDMAQQSEYAWQRASCQFSLGLAVGKKIKILIPKSSELCKYPKDYGFETDNANRHLAKTRIKSLQETIQGYQSQILDMQYQLETKHNQFIMFSQNTQAQIASVGDNMIRSSLAKSANENVIKFLSDMPDSLEQIKAKRDEIIMNIQRQNAEHTTFLDNAEKQIGELKASLERETKIDFMNKKSVEDSTNALTRQITVAQGAISEQNYNLANNRL